MPVKSIEEQAFPLSSFSYTTTALWTTQSFIHSVLKVDLPQMEVGF